VWAVFPLVGFASLGIDQFLRRVSESNRPVLIGEIVLTVSLIIFSILNLLAYFFNSYGDAVVDRNRLIGAGLPILLLMIMTAFLAWGWSPRSALQGLGLGLGLLLCVAFFSAGMKVPAIFHRFRPLPGNLNPSLWMRSCWSDRWKNSPSGITVNVKQSTLK